MLNAPMVTLVLAITMTGTSNPDISEFPVKFETEWDCQYHAVPIQREVQDQLYLDNIDADVDYVCVPKDMKQ